MYSAGTPVLHGHDWAVAAWTTLVVALVLGLTSNQTAQFFRVDSQLRERSVASATHELTTTARLATAHQDSFPIILTIPFAVTRTQRMMVARVKQRAETDPRDGQLKSAAKAAPRLLTGLALLGASQSSNH